MTAAQLPAVGDLLDTFLSQPDEWASLFVGLIAAVVIVYLTDDLAGALVAAVVFVLGFAAVLPLEVFAEWHYWGGMVAAVLLLGLYELGPKIGGR